MKLSSLNHTIDKLMHSLETVVDPIEADIDLIFDISVCPSHQGVRSKQEIAPNNSLQSTVNLLWPVKASRSRHDEPTLSCIHTILLLNPDDM